MLPSLAELQFFFFCNTFTKTEEGHYTSLSLNGINGCKSLPPARRLCFHLIMFFFVDSITQKVMNGFQ